MNQIKERYTNYINSSDWEEEKENVNNVYKQYNWPIVCVKCGKNSFLNLHHNYYSTYLNNQNISDYDFLCSNCHKKWHFIQKNNCRSQNNLIRSNLRFYISDKNLTEIENFIQLLKEKIMFDENVIKSFFSQEDVINYMEEDRKHNIIFFCSLIVSFPLLFFYGVGIITFFITLFLLKNKYAKPVHLDSFILRRNILEQKKMIISIIENNK